MEMTIGYDGKRAVRNNTGLGNYSRLIIESVAERYREAELKIYTPDLRPNPRLTKIMSYPSATFVTPASPATPGAVWRTYGITRRLRQDAIDIYHGLSNELPLNIREARIPSVVTIHDLIYRRLPYCYNPIDRITYDFKYGRSCHNADRIIAVSERTKLDIIEYYGIGEEKIDVVYQGCDPSFGAFQSGERLAEVRRKYSLPENYIIQVGTVERRKNLELTVKILPSLDRDINLVVVGRDRKGYAKRVKALAGELGVAGRVKWLEGLPFSDLPPLYAMARASVYPSLYEGFGIPVLESLTTGTPTVAACGSCLEEAGGDAALYVDPHDPRTLSEALRHILGAGADLKTMRERGRRHASRFDNSQMAEKVMEVYGRTISGCRQGAGR